MNRILSTISILLTLLLLQIPTDICLAQPLTTITGRVTDPDNQPIPGVSVMIFSDEDIITGTSTDPDGRYVLKFKPTTTLNTLRVSSVGFKEQKIKLTLNESTNILNIPLEPVAIEIKPIEVTPSNIKPTTEIILSTVQVTENSRQSLIPTNPVGALKQPEINRQGSNHSSQIRINGTNPKYYLNGTPMGTDPDHYGMFSVIPTTIIDEIKFYPQGTTARYALPSTIEFNTLTPFKTHRFLEMNLSTIEATGMGSVGNEKAFLYTSLRKSILDKIVKNFDISSDRQTLPPTNFGDFFISAGVRLSPHYRLMADQYYVRDYLSYNTASAVNTSENIRTYQFTNESYTAIRLDAMFDNLLVKFSGAQKSSQEEYNALPEKDLFKSKVYLNLSENRRTNLFNLEAAYLHDNYKLEIGSQTEYISYREIDLNQHNWNFLPPFTNSDNPYVYQQALNETYGAYYNRESILNNSEYISVKREGDRFYIETGLRVEYFKNLSEQKHLLWRQAVTYKTGEQSHLKLFMGTFAESPANNILEPYQILIDAHLNRLQPIKTRLTSIGWANRVIQASLFNKKIINLPTVTPDFEDVFNKDGSIADDFITVQSNGEARFYGGSISFEKDHFLTDRLKVLTSYAYTHAYRLDHGVTIPYELNAPHKFLTKVDYKFNQKFSMGSELQVRSGYPYTPARPILVYTEKETYNPEYYTTTIEQENSEQFPTNISLNLYGTYCFDNVELFFAVSNITNHANPIINAASGYIYDAGILPTIGIKWRW